MGKKPGLLDLVALVPAADLAKVARTLGLDPETLVKRVLALDSSGISTRLVDTATRALKPGEAGRLMLDHATRIFSQARDLTRDLEELAGLQAPELHFGTDMFAAELPLGAALGRMASANSRLRVHVETSDFDRLARDVLAGRIEFAVADTTSAERHPTRLAIEPVAEHRVFFYVRQGHPLAAAKEHSLATILVFPLVSPRLPQRIAGHFGKLATYSRVDRDTGDLTPNLLVDNFSLALKTVLGGDAVGVAPLVALETELRARRIALLPFTAPWLHLSYGLFYTRKRSLSRVAQLFMTQLRRIEADIQSREQRALLRLEAPKRHGRKTATRRKATAAPSETPTEPSTAATRSRRTRKSRR
ncbi:MAG TPA: LysR family transcriptional regulator [Steroidobacteraceae bacterium]|nr:LysR family transcriptional regulator [Steroidobacteraceae bacterium]